MDSRKEELSWGSKISQLQQQDEPHRGTAAVHQAPLEMQLSSPPLQSSRSIPARHRARLYRRRRRLRSCVAQAWTLCRPSLQELLV